MVEGRLRYYINGKFKKCPEFNCLMSSADSSWSGFLVERQKCNAHRLSVPVCVYNPRLLVVTGGELTVSSRSGGRVNWNTAPRGSFAVAHSRPPCALMIDRQIDSPMPIPPAFVV